MKSSVTFGHDATLLMFATSLSLHPQAVPTAKSDAVTCIVWKAEIVPLDCTP